MKKEKYFEKIRKKVGRLIYQHQLLEKDDKILVALSGGKDSLVMLETLANCRRFIPFNYEITACHILANGVGYKMDKDYLQSFCDRLDVKLVYGEIDVEIEEGSKKHPCFVCSWLRRKKLFSICRELGHNKIAFGHHLDDAVQTFFMNLINHGSISSLPQKIDFFNGDITMIRPLLSLNESDIQEYADLKEYKKELKSCMNEDKSHRFEMKNIISEIEKLNPNARLNIFRAMDNVFPDYLPKR